MLYEKLTDLVGLVPYGCEPLVFVITCVLLVWLLSTFFSVLWSFLSMFTGGR